MMPSPASIAVALIALGRRRRARRSRDRSRPSASGRKIALLSAAEQLLRVARDAVHHRREVERRRHVAADLRQRRRFARAALRLRRTAARSPARRPSIAAIVGSRCTSRVVERVLALEALDRDRADQRARRPSRARTRTTGWRRCPARRLRPIASISARLPITTRLGRSAARWSILRSGSSRRARVEALAVLVDVEVVDRLGAARRASGCRCRRCANTSRSLSPTRSTIAWKSSSAAMPCWMLLMTASSACALLGLLQQALRLVEQARVLERDAHARGDRRSRRTSASPNAFSRS